MKRLFLIFVILAALVLIPFLIWGDWFERSMSLPKVVSYFREQKDWAWLAGIGLLAIDLFLPILGTVVMSALGLTYGWFLGGLISAIGSMFAGIIAYGLCRKLGRPVALKIAGESGLREGERLFSGELAPWLVALSRWMPILPEVIACMAGLGRMPWWRYLVSLACGCVPLGFTFAYIGTMGDERPWPTLALSVGLPPLVWILVRYGFLKRYF
ncbi:MAG: VTT domain-containing protein [Verrucomicrobiota bacterium]